MNKATLAVFAVNDTYQIMVRTEQNSLMWIKAGEHCYYDHSNGILRSDTNIHRIAIPMLVLDKCGSYTICERPIIERKPYFSETGEVKETAYTFRPVTGNKIRAYHIADAHNMIDAPARAAEAYGQFDFLILNGDIPVHSGTCENFDNIYELCGRLTQGNIPIVFSQGNHDMRGVCAEKLEDYTPTASGNLITLSASADFGGLFSIAAKTSLIRTKNMETLFAATLSAKKKPNLSKRLSVKNNIPIRVYTSAPSLFMTRLHENAKSPFDIENDIYNEWTKMLRYSIKSDVMICGHLHEIALDMPWCSEDYRGQPCPVAIMSETDYKNYFVGAGFEFNKDGKIKITVTNFRRKYKKYF